MWVTKRKTLQEGVYKGTGWESVGNWKQDYKTGESSGEGFHRQKNKRKGMGLSKKKYHI